MGTCQQLDLRRAEQALTLPLGDVADIAGVHLGQRAEMAFDEVQSPRLHPQAMPRCASSACTRGEP
jgi:hypothetical protein